MFFLTDQSPAFLAFARSLSSLALFRSPDRQAACDCAFRSRAAFEASSALRRCRSHSAARSSSSAGGPTPPAWWKRPSARPPSPNRQLPMAFLYAQLGAVDDKALLLL